jgi:hypothetical protein
VPPADTTRPKNAAASKQVTPDLLIIAPPVVLFGRRIPAS